jgi:hypothetical protein
MWSVLFATLFPILMGQTTSSAGLLLLLLAAATPASLIICGVILQTLSFESSQSGLSARQDSRHLRLSRWPRALVLLM